MSRVLKLTLIVLASVLLVVGGLLWALPEIVRRVALARIPKLTGRVAAIGDIDLNLFTGRLAIKSFRLADRPGPEPFVEAERLDVRLSPLALLRSHIHLVEIALIAPSFRVVRTGPAEFNFSDLLAGTKEPVPTPSRAPSRWTVTVERLNIARGRCGSTTEPFRRRPNGWWRDSTSTDERSRRRPGRRPASSPPGLGSTRLSSTSAPSHCGSTRLGSSRACPSRGSRRAA